MYTCKIDREKNEITVFKETDFSSLEEKNIKLVPLLSSGTVLKNDCIGIYAKIVKSFKELDTNIAFNCITEQNERKSAFIKYPKLNDLIMLNNIRPYNNLDIMFFLLGFICGNLNDILITHYKDNTFNDFELPKSNIPNINKISDILTLIPHENNDFSLLQEYADNSDRPLNATRLYLIADMFSVMFNPSDKVKDYILNKMTIDDIFQFTLALSDFFEVQESNITKLWSNTIFLVEVL